MPASRSLDPAPQAMIVKAIVHVRANGGQQALMGLPPVVPTAERGLDPDEIANDPKAPTFDDRLGEELTVDACGPNVDMTALGCERGNWQVAKLIQVDAFVRKNVPVKWPGWIEIDRADAVAGSGKCNEVGHLSTDDPLSISACCLAPIDKIQEIARADFDLPFLCLIEPRLKLGNRHCREALRPRGQFAVYPEFAKPGGRKPVPIRNRFLEGPAAGMSLCFDEKFSNAALGAKPDHSCLVLSDEAQLGPACVNA